MTESAHASHAPHVRKREGVFHWWMQRITAAMLVPLSLWFVFSLLGMQGAGHAQAVEWIQSTHVTVLLVLLMVATFYHLELGLEVIAEDYIHSLGLRSAVIWLIKLSSVVLAIAGLGALFKIVVA